MPPDERARRFGCDVYHLGSMVVYFFTRFGATSMLISELHPQFRPGPGGWTGTYQQVLPQLQDAFAKVLLKVRTAVDSRFRAELTEVVRELCSPDPTLRGHPRNRGRFADQYSLERYVTQFDRLAVEAAYYNR